MSDIAIPAEQPSEVPPEKTEGEPISEEEQFQDINPRELIPEDEQFQHDDEGQLIGAAFDEDLFSSVTRLAAVMNPEWALLRSPDNDKEVQLAYELDKSSFYYKFFLDEMFAGKDSRALVEDGHQLTVTNIDVIENPYLYAQYHLKGQELRRRNGRVQEMMAYCVAPSYDDVVMGDLMPTGSNSIKLSATVFPLIDASVAAGTLVYCKVLISKTGGKTKPGKNSHVVDTLAFEDGSMEKFAQDELYPVCMIHYEIE